MKRGKIYVLARWSMHTSTSTQWYTRPPRRQMGDAHTSLDVVIQACGEVASLINTHNCDPTCHNLKYCESLTVWNVSSTGPPLLVKNLRTSRYRFHTGVGMIPSHIWKTTNQYLTVIRYHLNTSLPVNVRFYVFNKYLVKVLKNWLVLKTFVPVKQWCCGFFLVLFFFSEDSQWRTVGTPVTKGYGKITETNEKRGNKLRHF